MWDLSLVEQVGFERRNWSPYTYVLHKASIENQLHEGSHQQSNPITITGMWIIRLETLQLNVAQLLLSNGSTKD